MEAVNQDLQRTTYAKLLLMRKNIILLPWKFVEKKDKKEWKSKYNSYVVYDYEPFCSDGFEINLTISSFDVNYVNFLKFLFENKVKTIEYLKGCMTA